MDGTIYLGGRIFPASKPFLATLQALGITYSFLTNNSSQSAAEYVTHLRRLGIEAGVPDVFTSAHATIELIQRSYPALKRLYLVGTTGLRSELEASGFEVLAEADEARPDAVVVGFDPQLRFANLCKASHWIGAGLPYFATHPDRVCPTDSATVLLDCGAICAAIHAAIGREPDAIGGKPQPAMLHALAHRLGVTPGEIAMVGDRLYTDLRMAKDAGAFGVLTLTGETQPEDLLDAEVRPDVVVADLSELEHLFRLAHAPTS